MGDRFMTNEVLTEAFRDATEHLDLEFELVYLSDGWPVEPMKFNDEVREYCGTDDEIVPVIADCEVFLTHTGCITRKVIEAAPRLKVIGVGRGGPTNINLAACTARGIPVCFAPGRNSGAVAEYAVGLILAVTRNIVSCHTSFHRDGNWRGDMYAFEYISDELGQSTVGLVGTGAIGNKVARLVQAFGAQVIAYDPYVPSDRRLEGVEYVGLDEVFARADVVSLHARYTAETARMVNARRLALMKPTAVVVNTARGELVDYDALYAALADGRLKGAALDVFEAEPPPADSKLFQLENVIATTHLGGASKQAASIGARVASQGIAAFLAGERPQFLSNPESIVKES
jgi:D-3-phosphoglycerate dehydrogenase